jgi:protein-disulfide isomerase
MNRRKMMILTAGAAVAAFTGATWWGTQAPPAVETAAVAPEIRERLVRPHSPVLGPEDAPVTIVEFFDPACESCRVFYPVVKDIMAEYPQEVRLVLRYTPFHGKISEEAILTLEAARLQGVYEPVLDALMREQPKWATHRAPPEAQVLEVASTAGLDAEAARKQMRMPDLVAVLNQDRADVEAVGVRGTPTFFVNGKPLSPFGEAELRALVASEVENAAS